MRLEVFGRVIAMTGRVVQTFEDTISDEIPEGEWASVSTKTRTYTRSLALPISRYRIEIAAKDVNGDRVGAATTLVRGLPSDPRAVEASSLILADGVQASTTRNLRPGKLLVGDTEISPLALVGNPPKAFVSGNQTLNAWMQVYGLQTEPKTRSPKFQIDYEIVSLVNKGNVKREHQDQNDFKTAGEQATLTKSFLTSELPKGDYRLTVTVRDDLSTRCVQREALFEVAP